MSCDDIVMMEQTQQNAFRSNLNLPYYNIFIVVPYCNIFVVVCHDGLCLYGMNVCHDGMSWWYVMMLCHDGMSRWYVMIVCHDGML